MGRSSRVLNLVKVSAVAAGTSLVPFCALAQVYGFPSDVGVIDDGYGTLPPEAPRSTPEPLDSPMLNSGMLPAMAMRRPVPPCPLVIQVGGGLRRSAHTRVTYGRPACS